MSATPGYRFPGMSAFVAGEGVNPSFAAKIPGLFFCCRAGDALAQLCEAHPAHRPAMMVVAVEARDALALALATVDSAIATVRHECMPPEPAPAPAPEPEPTPEPAPAPPEPVKKKVKD